MTHRAIPLVFFLPLIGCAVAHEGLLDDSGALPSTHDAGAPEPAPDAGGAPCGGGCLEGVCDEASGACVECVSAADCGGERCVENQCASCDPDEAGCGAEPPPPDPDPDPTPPPPPPEEPEEPATEPAPEPPAGARPFRIRFATYNVRTSNLNNAAWRDLHEGWDSNDAARMHRVADEIAGQRLNVVAAQEMRPNERNAVLDRLRREHGQEWGHTTYRQRGLDDTAVLYRRSVWRKVRETHFIIPLQGDLRDRYQVGVLLEHRASGRAVWFYSVHFAAGGAAGADERAVAARRTVASIRERAVETGRPFVLGGDFNATSGSRVGDIFRAAGFMKYTRRVADRRINNGCKTFNGRAGWEGHQQCPGGTAAHIDQVWVSRAGMRVETYRVTATRRTSRASDHNPLTTLLERP